MTPKELYRFVEGSQVWTLTSADADEVYNAGEGDETYISTTIGRNEIENKNQLSRANIEVSFDLDNQMARRWMRQISEAVVTLTIFAKDKNGVVSVNWKGRLASVKPERTAITLIFESVFTSLRRPGLRARYQRACRHVLYGRGCALDKESFAVVGRVTAVSNETVIIPEAAGFANGYFTGGMIEGPDGALRFITNHNGQTLTLIRTLESIVEGFAAAGYGKGYGMSYGGLSCRIFPGCPRERNICNDRFNNLPNYGGFPFIPLRNPFDGSSII